jgi:hypothetical protein
MNKNYQNQEMGPAAMQDGVQNVASIDGTGVANVNPYADLEESMKEYFGDDFRLDDAQSQKKLTDFFYRNVEQNRQLASVLGEDPRLAQLLADVVNGKRNAHAAMARYYGRSFLDFEEGSPEYEEMLMMDEERRREALELARNRRTYEDNLEASRPIIEQFCKERGYEPAQFLDCVWEQLVFPILSGSYSPEVCLALDHAVSYEQDVEDAFEAGNIKGRNTNIRRMQENFGDGLPKNMSSVAPPQSGRRGSKVNSLIDAALNA